MDSAAARGFAILPSRMRFDTHLPAFFEAAVSAGMTIPGCVVVNSTEYAQYHQNYDSLILPENWSILTVTGESASEKTEQARREFMTDGTDYVFWLSDDVRPITPEWDKRMIESLTGFNFVSVDDQLFAPAHMGAAFVWSADLIRAVGFLFLPTVRHMYSDTAWEELGHATGCWTCDMSILVKHIHESKTGKKDSTTQTTNESWVHDDKAILEWRKNDKAPTVERILELMASYGVEMVTPDLHGVEVMLAVPNGSGRYENLFVDSLRRTEQYVQQYGGEFRFMEMSYCSDIYIARARIVGAFLRSTADYLFMIDDDQAWEPMDFVRFLMAKRDFLAAASVRKVEPPSFAVSVADDAGRPTPMKVEQVGPDHYYFHVSHVGAAFLCLSRACLERLVEAYPQLEFDAAEGRTEVALFDPLIVGRRRYSEDYALCHRWRAIGGTVLVDPNVNLRHVGVRVYSGSWIENLAQAVAEQQGAA